MRVYRENSTVNSVAVGKFKWKCSSWCAILCPAVSVVLFAVSSQARPDYVAAVVEYSPIVSDAPRKTILENVAQYETIINNASRYGVEIIVFPEAGLTTVHLLTDRNATREYVIEVPSPENRTSPCSDPKYDEVLQRLSCAAKTNKVYTAVNFIEISYCNDDDKNCPQDKAYFYNTNIVFDRQGTIIARYRKYNLFNEKSFIDSTAEPDLCTFETDFGVTFGMFICFDIMFTEPSVRLVKEKGVTDIVYSTAWYSEMPLLTATATQAGWAHSLNVNLLTAGYNRPQTYSGGSGIYGGAKGPLVVLMPRQMGTTLLIATVPKAGEFLQETTFSVPEAIDAPNTMKFLQDPSLPSFEKVELSSSGDDVDNVNRLSYDKNNFSCNVEVVWRNRAGGSDYKNYKMIAYSGMRNFDTASRNHVESCGLTLCHQETLSSGGLCAIPDFDAINSSVEVRSIKISAKSYNVSSIAIPSTLNASMYPLKADFFTFRSSVVRDEGSGAEVYSIEMNLIMPTSQLVTFVVYKLPSGPSSDHRTRR